MQITLAPELTPALNKPIALFDQVMALEGRVYRELENRRTLQVSFGINSYFVKQHFGIGWREIFKNLLQLRLPVISAKNEWHALKRLEQLAIPVPKIVGYGCRGTNPARLQSFLITRELPRHITLEDFCKNWIQQPPSFKVKHQILKEVARISRIMHQSGINHRDFYICHFLLDLKEYSKGYIKLYLLDLHRAQIRAQVPKRWRIKDLAGLFFSSHEIGLTKRDRMRFIKEYRDERLREVLKRENNFWNKVKNRGNKLYFEHAS